MFCLLPDSKSEQKKWATSQSFIRKEITTYRIGTLEGGFFQLFWGQKNLCMELGQTVYFWNYTISNDSFIIEKVDLSRVKVAIL